MFFHVPGGSRPQRASLGYQGRALLLVNILVVLLAATYGFDHLWSPTWRDGIYRVVSFVWLVSLGGLLGVTLLGTFRPVERNKLDQLGACCCIVQVSLTLFFHLPTRAALPAICALAFCSRGFARRAGAPRIMQGAMIVGLLIYVAALASSPLEASRADMLPVIMQAIDSFLAGSDPYTLDYRAITANPFFYPPSQWLIFLPVRIAGLDLRLLNLLSLAAMVALVEYQARRGRSGLRAGIYPVLLSPLVYPMMLAGQVWPYWLCILGFATLVLRERWISAAAVIAFAIGMRQTAILPAGAALVGMLTRGEPIIWARALLAALAVLLAAFVPFIIASPTALHLMFVEGPRQALVNAHLQGNPGNQVALSNWTDWLGWATWDSRVEAAFAFATVPLSRLAARRDPQCLLTVAGLCYAITIAANPYLHRYYYVAGLLLCVAGLSGRPVSADLAHDAKSGGADAT